MPQPGTTEFIIERELGCGAFQVVQVIALYVVSVLPTYCTVQMMSFGSYNPGWRCSDNTTTTLGQVNNSYDYDYEAVIIEFPENNFSAGYMDSYGGFSCQVYTTCQDVDFDPSTSTIVTEWNLLCDKAWIPRFIISIKMSGLLVGSLLAGHIADRVGRKKAFYGSLFSIAVLNFASAFSVSWRMFAVIAFFIGVFCAGVMGLYYVYPSEFLPRKWRAPLTGFPAWSMSGIFYGLITMAMKDWRKYQVTVGAMTMFSFMSVGWVPESLRWLEIKNRDREYKLALEKMAKLNRKEMPEIESVAFIERVESEVERRKSVSVNDNVKVKYTYLDLFHRGYRLETVILAVVWLSLTVIYVSISYGISILGGQFYLNLVVMNLMAVPCAIFPILAPNIFGRKRSLSFCYFMIAIALGTATYLELKASGKTKDTGIIVIIMFVIACTESARSLIVLVITEIYPTVVRSLAVSWAHTISRLGAIVAPIFIPRGSETVYKWYLVMVFLGFFCGLLVMFLPETKGKPLKETFEPGEKDSKKTILINEADITQ